jgi:hypothetical protein
VSGWQLVTGVTAASGSSGQHLNPQAQAVIAFLAILIALALTLGGKPWARVGQVLAAGVAAIALLALKADLDGQAAQAIQR